MSHESTSWLPVWLRPWPAPSRDTGQQHESREAKAGGAHVGAEAGPSRRSIRDQGDEEEQGQSTIGAPYITGYADMENDDDDESQGASAAGPTLGIPVTGAVLGFGAGFYQSAKKAGLVFMAENAHRRPDTVQGWYFYNKTKNYRVMLAAIKGGLRTGMRMGLWTLAFVTLETGIARLRRGEDVWQDVQRVRERYDEVVGGRDTTRARAERQASAAITVPALPAWAGHWVDGAGAGLGVAVGASLLYRLPRPMARRALGFGTAMGATMGTMRDAQALVAQKKQVDNAMQTEKLDRSA